MEPIIVSLQQIFPELRFRADKQFFWSPESSEIVYDQSAIGSEAEWSLLHETGHALLKHKNYNADIRLLGMEIEAWEKARSLAKHLGKTIDEEHIEDCLDTYRDWLNHRSICPSCGTQCLQQSGKLQYRCFNCHTIWKVSNNRFCRAYRATKNTMLANK